MHNDKWYDRFSLKQKKIPIKKVLEISQAQKIMVPIINFWFHRCNALCTVQGSLKSYGQTDGIF